METRSILVLVKPEEIAYLRATLESYDGMAVVSTLDAKKAVIEVRVSPGCEDFIHEIFEDLVRREGVCLTTMKPFDPGVREGK
jgi:hypothetical protein